MQPLRVKKSGKKFVYENIGRCNLKKIKHALTFKIKYVLLDNTDILTSFFARRIVLYFCIELICFKIL